MQHFAGHWRDAFYAWVEDGMSGPASVEVDYEPVTWPARKLLGQMVHCTDIMPAELCDELGMERGSTYARAAQWLLHQRTHLEPDTRLMLPSRS